MNIIMVHDGGIFVSSFFNEDEEYFTMCYKEGDELIICSQAYPPESSWQKIANDSVRAW
jgi:hypothetical protein